MSVITCAVNTYHKATTGLETMNTWLPAFVLRVVLAWEFAEAGFEKLHGMNWFYDLSFPFPFNLLPPELSWNISMAFEIVGAAAILVGLATRFFSIALIILTIVAISAVHWPEHWSGLSELLRGYRFIDEDGDGFGNYKLPLLYIVMFLPLLLGGAGKLSLDYWLKRNSLFGL
jgi:putative oxidoreductase